MNLDILERHLPNTGRNQGRIVTQIISSSSEDETEVPLVSTGDNDSSDEDDVPRFVCGKHFFEDNKQKNMNKMHEMFQTVSRTSLPKVKKFVCDFGLDGQLVKNNQ